MAGVAEGCVFESGLVVSVTEPYTTPFATYRIDSGAHLLRVRFVG